jgi:hypothetical protein
MEIKFVLDMAGIEKDRRNGRSLEDDCAGGASASSLDAGTDDDGDVGVKKTCIAVDSATPAL